MANSGQRCRWLCAGGADGGRSAAVFYGALDMESFDMTREDIIRMARESGMAGFDGTVHAMFQLEAFAFLVAAAEREACAKVCEEVGVWPALGPKHCAEAIRARGQA